MYKSTVLSGQSHVMRVRIMSCYSVTFVTIKTKNILMFIHRDLFLPDSRFIQIFIYTGTCKFMQTYASSCNNYASLLQLFLLFPVQRVLHQSKVLFYFSSFFWSRVFFFHDVSARSEPSSGGGIRQEKRSQQAECCDGVTMYKHKYLLNYLVTSVSSRCSKDHLINKSKNMEFFLTLKCA